MSEQMTFLDFFSGIGGFRQGLSLCGMKCKGHCEIDKYADRSYRAIFDIQEDEWYGEDIRKVTAGELPRVNIWTGGFPCQDISISGKQSGLDGSRSGLFFEIVRLLEGTKPEDRPEWIILENVKNILSIHGGWDFATVLYSLAALGYCVEYGLLNSKFHGVPHNRDRVYIVAHRHFGADSGRKVFPVECSDSETLIQLIGGSQGNRVYDANGISCTITADAGGFGGKTGLYFIDLSSGHPQLTDNARCIKARYTAGVTNYIGENSGVLCVSEQCPDRSDEVSFVQFKRGNPKLREESTCIGAGYTKHGVNNFGESTGVFYGCRAVLTPDREKKRQNGRRFKECGEPSFCLTAQDQHGIYLCSCDNCEKALPIKEATKQGYAEAKCGDSIVLAFPNSKTRRGRVGDKEAHTLDTSCSQGTPFVGCGRIRRLTPKECWRLQGYEDYMIDKAIAVNSDNQLYRQAGNGVTVPVVYAVGKRIIEIERQLEAERKGQTI